MSKKLKYFIATLSSLNTITNTSTIIKKKKQIILQNKIVNYFVIGFQVFNMVSIQHGYFYNNN